MGEGCFGVIFGRSAVERFGALLYPTVANAIACFERVRCGPQACRLDKDKNKNGDGDGREA